MKYTLKPISDTRHREDAQFSDAGWHPLTNKQKGILSMLAARAAAKAGMSDSKAVTAWRRETAIIACGRRISEATQANWADLKSMFLSAAGEVEKAFTTQLREGDNKRRVAMHKLTTALAAKNLPAAYAASICFAQFKVPLAEASAKQLWCLFYTVQNRRHVTTRPATALPASSK